MRRSLPNGNAPARTKRGAPDSPTKNGATAIRSRSTQFPVKTASSTGFRLRKGTNPHHFQNADNFLRSLGPTRTTVATRPSRSSFSPGASPAAITTLSPGPVEKKRDSESRSPLRVTVTFTGSGLIPSDTRRCRREGSFNSNEGSSRRTVSAPTITASQPARKTCTSNAQSAGCRTRRRASIVHVTVCGGAAEA